MVKEAIGTGETVLAAQEAACKELGVETHEAEFEVLQMPEKKLFGLFGGSPAKVRAYIATTPAQAAEEYLRDVLTHMGVNDVELTVEETEGGSAGAGKPWMPCNISPASWQTMWIIPITGLP